MARVETIIVGSGISATSPFDVGAIPYIVSTDPASISATPNVAFTTGTGGTHPALVVAAGRVDPQPAASAVLRVSGGAIIEAAGQSDSIVIGRGASVNTANVAIGTLATANSSGCMAVGNSAAASGNNSTAIGEGASANGGGGSGRAVALGNGATASGVFATALGANSTASATAAISLGPNMVGTGAGTILVGNNIDANGVGDNVVIAQGGLTAQTNWAVIHGGTPTNLSAAATPLVIVGGGAMTVTHAGNIVLGHGYTSFAANVCAIGGSATNSFIGTVVVGRGNTHTATLGGLTFRCTDGVTTNNLGMGDLTIIAPRGTGNATPGAINLQTGVAQASGNTSQTARTGFAVQSSAAAGDTDALIFDVNTATLKRISVGANDSGGAGFKLLRVAN